MQLSGPEITKRRARVLRGTMSLPEVLLWRELRRKATGLRFRRQHPAGPYVLDFYCDSARLCIEVDGDQHGQGDAVQHDRARDAWLAQQGVTTIRVAAVDVLRNLEGVVRMIADHAPSASLCSAPPPMGEDLVRRNPPPPGEVAERSDDGGGQ